MTTTEKQMVDAIVADLQANVLAGVPHKTWLYVEPRALRADVSKSWLCVYPTQVQHEVISTKSSYDDYARIRVEWRSEVFTGMEFNDGDQAAAEAGLVTFSAIKARLETYGAGVPGLAANDTAELIESKFGSGTNGMWFGYTLLDIETFGGVL